MRKVILIGVIGCAIGLSLFFLLRVYATPPPPVPTWTVRLHSAYGLQVGDAVTEAGRRIGRVVEVKPHTEFNGETNADILITLDAAFRDRLRQDSALFLTKPAGSTRPVLCVVVLDERSPVLAPGSLIIGAESRLELELKRQLYRMVGAVRGLSQQLEDFRRTLDKTGQSEEKRRLEESMGGLFETLQRTRDDVVRAVTQEVARWRKLYDKLFPPEGEKPAKLVS